MPAVPCSADAVIAAGLARRRRALLFGAPGTGKSTLAAELGRALAVQNQTCWCLTADPGSPAFGVPGALALGQWLDDGWQTQRLAALCTLDAGRFRLPLVQAVRRLAAEVTGAMLIIDGPGVVRGVAGTELLQGIAEAADVDLILAFSRGTEPPPLLAELQTLGVEVLRVTSAAGSIRPGKKPRARQRTVLWERYLTEATEQEVNLDMLALVGTPPPRSVPSAWTGRQLAVLEGSTTVALGEIVRLRGDGRLSVRMPKLPGAPRTLLVRDAVRTAGGMLETALPFAAEKFAEIPSAPPTAYDDALTVSPALVGRVGTLSVTLVNGVLGDPLLHVRLQHQRRSLLFDLGEGRRLSARTAHEVSDVFVTHAHMDHIGGFLWLLRSRIGELPVCRIYGPAGIAAHIDGMLRGILWDRAGERAPRFEVTEVRGDQLLRFELKADQPMGAAVAMMSTPHGVIRAEAGFLVRAIVLDHGTPVLAYAFEPTEQINVRKERLSARGLAPGPWLGQLKQAMLGRNSAAPITLPDGTIETAAELGADLTLTTPGKRLVYATDFADTPDNRRRLVQLARDAHTLFCEASFMESDREQAQRTGHLTGRACGEIGTEAGVARLVPFHFSRRYAHDLSAAYEEIAAACSRVVSAAPTPPAQPRE